jgi:hypothetical protein
VYISSFEEIISKSLSAKILILTNEPDELILLAEKNLPLNMFHVIRGSPDPFFVEFLVPGVIRDQKKQLIHIQQWIAATTYRVTLCYEEASSFI